MLSEAELNLSTDALTVEQAIEHALAVYEQNDCNMCGRQHKQLATWLTELLSLREQLAELKALPPIGQIVLSDYDSDGTRTARVVCLHDHADWDNFQDGTLLFTEAKPS
ncbi:hypothetical protein V1956_15645 [Yersinia sp. 2540 StPb PI]|uniref:hypothetical protein n=1 Tax=Yersinia sp. 2540 StPb PI TaxID=3117406 RepID=UPI003FA44166